MEMRIREIEVKNVVTKSNLPVCEYSVNPYVGCTHGCRYCYANRSPESARHRAETAYDPDSPFLCSSPAW